MDISPLRRVNQAIYLLTTGAREAAFRNVKTIAECLADELVNAAKGSSNRSVAHTDQTCVHDLQDYDTKCRAGKVYVLRAVNMLDQCLALRYLAQ